jgi:hypothetical protein
MRGPAGLAFPTSCGGPSVTTVHPFLERIRELDASRFLLRAARKRWARTAVTDDARERAFRNHLDSSWLQLPDEAARDALEAKLAQQAR